MNAMRQLIAPILLLAIVFGQESQQDKFHFEFDMDSVEINVGESKEITIRLLDESGNLAQNPFYVFGVRKSLSVSPRISDSTGVATVTLKAHKPGRLMLRTQTITVKRDDRIRDNLVVNVPYPPISKVTFNKTPSKLYIGTVTPLSVGVTDEAGLDRSDMDVALVSSNSSVADFDLFGNLETFKKGKTTISATADNVTESFDVRVVKNPVRSVTLTTESEEILN